MVLRPTMVLAILLIGFPLAANAYVDPGAGMLFWQGFIAVIGAALVFIRNPLSWIKRLILRCRRK